MTTMRRASTRSTAVGAALALLLGLVAVTAAGAAPSSPGTHTYGQRFCEEAHLARARPGFHPALAVDHRLRHPGETVYSRTEARGSEGLQYGLAYEVQRLAGESWRTAPKAPGPNTVWPQIAVMQVGASTRGCDRYRIPASAPPGRYRFVKTVTPAGTGEGRTLYAPFVVRGG